VAAHRSLAAGRSHARDLEQFLRIGIARRSYATRRHEKQCQNAEQNSLHPAPRAKLKSLPFLFHAIGK
jgi:hypothetical protein